MTEARSPRRPGPAAVLWGSVALFAVFFALLTYQLSGAPAPGAAGATAPVQVRKVIKRRIVTTVVPAPGASPATSVVSALVTTSSYEAGAEPVTTSAS